MTGDNDRADDAVTQDLDGEWNHAVASQQALLNILEDASEEKALLADVQRAVLNILEDFDIERKNVERVNADLHYEITERARAETSLRRANAAADAANKELESFSYSVAHDLRAPLRSIDGFSQALVEDCGTNLPPEGKTYLTYLRKSAQHMARLIDDLLSLSRLGRTAITRSRIDLASIAQTVNERLRRDHPHRQVDVVIAAEMPGFGDPRMLEIVFENLLGNAWKFTGKRDHAHIEVGQTFKDGQMVYFVRDDGAGFDMDYADKLFAVFQRLHTSGEFEGTGVGLANVDRIIRRHGGHIWGSGEVGRGAIFWFTLEDET